MKKVDRLAAAGGGRDPPEASKRDRVGGCLCFARALLRRPGLLILDEATNALDRAVEDRLLDTFARLRGTTTVLMITHRLPDSFPVDRRWRIEDARLVESS